VRVRALRAQFNYEIFKRPEKSTLARKNKQPNRTELNWARKQKTNGKCQAGIEGIGFREGIAVSVARNGWRGLIGFVALYLARRSFQRG